METEQLNSPSIEEVFAQPRDPGLGVHVLSQFVFCERAGIIEMETNQQDAGVEEDLTPRANVDYMPRYDLTEIHREIERTVGRLLWFVPFPITASTGTVVCWWRYGILAAALGIVLTVMLSGPIAALVRRLLYLRELRAYALSWTPRVPDPDTLENQEVEWWELINAGFQSHRSPEKMEHSELRLSGNPWRILIRGDLRIPVFKDRRVKGRKDAKLRAKHYARIAAYCHLVERSMGGISPYGIVLYGDSFEGTAIAKNARGTWIAFKDGILDARNVISGSRADPPVTPSPAPSNLCSKCRHGKPFSTGSRPRERTLSLPVFGAQCEDGRTYHSTCGDRFQWLPPHEKAVQKNLRI